MKISPPAWMCKPVTRQPFTRMSSHLTRIVLLMSLTLATVRPCNLNASAEDECHVNATYSHDPAVTSPPPVTLSCLSLLTSDDQEACPGLTSIDWVKTHQHPARHGSISTDLAHGGIVISGPNKRDAGQYKLTYKFQGDGAPVTCLACLVAKPLVLNFTKDEYQRSLAEGSDVTISREFEVIGYPVTEVIWFKDGQRLHSSDLVEISTDAKGHKGGKLRLPKVTMSQAGLYECRAMLGDEVASSKSIRFRVTTWRDWALPLGLVGLQVVAVGLLQHFLTKRQMSKRARMEKRVEELKAQYYKELAKLKAYNAAHDGAKGSASAHLEHMDRLSPMAQSTPSKTSIAASPSGGLTSKLGSVYSDKASFRVSIKESLAPKRSKSQSRITSQISQMSQASKVSSHASKSTKASQASSSRRKTTWVPDHRSSSV